MLILSANTFSDGLPMLTRLICLQKLGLLALQRPMVRWTRLAANSGESPVACISIHWTRLTAYSGDSNLWRVFGSGELLVQTLSRWLCPDSDRYVDDAGSEIHLSRPVFAFPRPSRRVVTILVLSSRGFGVNRRKPRLGSGFPRSYDGFAIENSFSDDCGHSDSSRRSYGH